MKILVTALSLLALSTTYAAENDYKHQVSFGNNVNSGWSSTGGTAKTDDSMGIDEFLVGEGELSLNYSHTFAKQFQLGFIFDRDLSKTEIEMESGDEAEITEDTTSLMILGAYNFSPELQNSWYLGFGLGRSSTDDKTTSTSGSVTKQEYDIDGYLLFVGKRFSLDFLGIQNLTYSPMVSYQTGKVDGDLEDDGVEEITQVTFDILKLDLLF